MIKKVKSQWFLLGLVTVFFAVLLDPNGYFEQIGQAAKRMHGPECMIFLIFIISGLMLDTRQMRTGIKDITATMLALFVILIVAPLFAWLISFLPLEFGVMIGLFIVSAMPTTLSSGVVMTKTAGGNMAHALFVTIVSNSIAIFSIPIVLSLLLASLKVDKQFLIDTGSIVFKLSSLVLFPLVAGLILRIFLLRFFNFKKFQLQILNQVLIICIVFVSVANAKQALVGDKEILAGIVGISTLFHLMLIGMAYFLIKLLKIEKGRLESVMFMGAQKTLPLSVMIQVTYFNEYGLALVVCVCHHIVHLLIDGYLSTKMGQAKKS